MREIFDKNGWYKQDAVLSTEEVDQLRSDIFDIVRKEYGNYVRILPTPRLIKYNELLQPLVKRRVIECLKSILGESYVIIGDMQIQINSYGSINTHGWHIDAGSEELHNEDLNDPDYRFMKCGIFLQDSNDQTGGGIQLNQGFHKLYQVDLLGLNKKFKNKIPRVITKILRKNHSITPVLRKGDFLTFHSCLPHRSSPVSQEYFSKLNTKVQNNYLPVEATGEEAAKIVVYFNVTTKDYVKNHIMSNALRVIDEIKSHVNNDYTFYNHFRLREIDFHHNFINELHSNGLELGLFDSLERYLK